MRARHRTFRSADLALAAGVVAGILAVVTLATPSRSEVSAPPLHQTAHRSADEPEASTASRATTTTAVPAPRHPLTGATLDRPVDDRRAIAVKVDGLGGVPALHGLDQADVIFEELVEGGLVRMIAVFQSTLPTRVGPVRSVRTSDLHVLGALGEPVLVFSGGNPRTVADTLHAPLLPFPPVRRAGDRTFWRDERLRAPHNLFVDLTAVAAGSEVGGAPPAQFERRDPAAERPGTPQPALSVAFSGVSTTGFVWSEVDHGWIRSLDGRVQRDGQGRPLVVQNVVVLATPYGLSPYDAHSPEARPVGSGAAWVFSGGRVQRGTWERPDDRSPWRLLGDDGTPLRLDVGRTWVELQPADVAAAAPPSA